MNERQGPRRKEGMEGTKDGRKQRKEKEVDRSNR